MNTQPYRQIRAVYDEHTIRVYQAYSDAIADSALEHGTFKSPPFSMERMTWIKPSFLWMMYRSGWAKKDDRQKRVLAADISRPGFEWALEHSCLSHYADALYPTVEDWEKRKRRTSVRIQWDPERDIRLNRLEYRSLQVGLKGQAVGMYVNEWIRKLTDITDEVHAIHAKVNQGDIAGAEAMLPREKPYPYSFT